MKISITITDATPEEASVFFQAYAINKTLPPGYAADLLAYRPAPTQCDGPGSEAPYGGKPEATPLNTLGNTLIMSDGSRRDNPADEAVQKARKPRAKKEEKASEAPVQSVPAPSEIPVVPPTPILPPKPAAEAPVQAPATAPETPAGEIPVISPEDLRANMQQLYLTGQRGAGHCTNLLKEFGVKKLADLREDQRNAFQAGIEKALDEVQNG